MAEDLIQRLRALRRRAEVIHSTLVPDLKVFQVPDGTFKRLPTARGPDISVTTTCTVMMALAASDRLQEFYANDSKVKSAFNKVVRADWDTAGLGPNNGFTSSLVLRAAGLLKETSRYGIAEADKLQHERDTLNQIVQGVAAEFREKLKVQSYPLKPAIVYWFVDGVARLGTSLEEENWGHLAEWTAHEFAVQLEHVVAEDDALMDPVSLIMAASLAKRIRRACDSQIPPDIINQLPGEVELRYAAAKLFECQGKSGIWPKYFPLFHFDDTGANHCFTFEFLEALLNEYSPLPLFQTPLALDGIEKALVWCEQNRRSYPCSHGRYEGWHSGGDINTLKKGMPESWATAVVHVFLCRLCDKLSAAIQDLVFLRYGVTSSPQPKVAWVDLLEAPIKLPSNPRTTVKTLLQDHMIDPGLSRRRCKSALLFGPPGTSKTTLVAQVANRMGRKLVEITPSHFLDKGLEKIYIRADEIFEDLMDLSDAVVLFDEMDALVQSRDPKVEQQQLDVMQQFLTTSMLPKLAKLHDQGRVVFFMATNHMRSFDAAILRPGRFDMLLCVSPPTWEEKLKHIDRILKRVHEEALTDDDVEAISERLSSLTRSNKSMCNRLDRFTFDETGNFLREAFVGPARKPLVERLRALSKPIFSKRVMEWSERYITLKGGLLKEYRRDCKESRLQA